MSYVYPNCCDAHTGQDVFYRMRSYGAAIADIALLLIAADDGVSNSAFEIMRHFGCSI